jgi:hypothetical protein
VSLLHLIFRLGLSLSEDKRCLGTKVKNEAGEFIYEWKTYAEVENYIQATGKAFTDF